MRKEAHRQWQEAIQWSIKDKNFGALEKALEWGRQRMQSVESPSGLKGMLMSKEARERRKRGMNEAFDRSIESMMDAGWEEGMDALYRFQCKEIGLGGRESKNRLKIWKKWSARVWGVENEWAMENLIKRWIKKEKEYKSFDELEKQEFMSTIQTVGVEALGFGKVRVWEAIAWRAKDADGNGRDNEELWSEWGAWIEKLGDDSKFNACCEIAKSWWGYKLEGEKSFKNGQESMRKWIEEGLSEKMKHYEMEGESRFRECMRDLYRAWKEKEELSNELEKKDAPEARENKQEEARVRDQKRL